MTETFTVPRTIYRLEFHDDQYEGLVVRVRAMSLGESMRAYFELTPQPSDDVATGREKQRELHEMFLGHVVDWNLTEENGHPVPATLDGLHSFEPAFVGLLVGTWRVGRAAIPAPLEPNSTGGEQSPVESTLTDIPSESLAS